MARKKRYPALEKARAVRAAKLAAKNGTPAPRAARQPKDGDMDMALFALNVALDRAADEIARARKLAAKLRRQTHEVTT